MGFFRDKGFFGKTGAQNGAEEDSIAKEIRRINVRRRVSRPGEDISLDNDRAFFYT